MKKGFTLVEMSIVLVVIGLIIGGVLVGRDLIASATIRATISQKERYDAAANTFRNKYNCLPGDCTSTAAFGSDPATAGDGNGRIGATTTDLFGGGVYENQYFWQHLQDAGLINDLVISPSGLGNLGTVTPRAKIILPYSIEGPGGWGVVADARFDTTYGGGGFQQHSFVLGQAIADIYFSYGYGFNPADIYAIDVKIDDGLPTSGSMHAYVTNENNVITGYSYVFGCSSIGVCFYPPVAPGPNNIGCITNNTPPQYNVLFQYGGPGTFYGLCSAVMKAGF